MDGNKGAHVNSLKFDALRDQILHFILVVSMQKAVTVS